MENLTKKERKALKRQQKEEAKLQRRSAKKRKKMIGWSVLVIAVIFIIFIIAWFAAKSEPRELSWDLDAQNPYQGDKESSIVIREFSDFQCPACKSAAFNIKQFLNDYKDKVKFIYYDFPLISIHDNARRAAEAARCAEAQGNFWGFHDMLFERQKGWEGLKDPDEVFASYAKELELDDAALRICLDEERYKDIVQDNLDKAYELGLNSTPTIFINDEKMRGVQSAEQLKEKIDELLEE